MKLLSLIILFSLFWSCSNQDGPYSFQGEAQGTYYTIKYSGVAFDAEEGIDSILKSVDENFSTYINNSLVSKFNKSENGIEVNKQFSDLWEKCWELNIESDGYFDPTLAPVIYVYKTFESHIDTPLVIEALSQTGMPLISLDKGMLKKKNKSTTLDLDGVAQGYTVDVVAQYLEEHGILNYLVEIGGEVRVRGKNAAGHFWKVGIDKPISEGGREIISSIELRDMSIATSGNYRKFKVIEGKIVGHILDPKTGFPAETDLLSASVFSKDCYRADGLATAFMNMTTDQVIGLTSGINDVSVFLIYVEGQDTLTYISPEIERFLSID